MVFVTFLFGLMMLLPGTHASSDHQRREELRRRADVRIRDVSDKVKAFAQDFGADLAEKANAQGQNGEVFAHNLVADVVSSVCDEYFSGTRPGDFTPVVVQNCVKSIYGGERLAQPAGQFFAVFGASLLCDYVVSEAYPVAQEFFPDGCEGLQNLAKKITPNRSAAASNVVTPAASQASQPPASVSPPTQPSASNLPASNAVLSLNVQPSASASNVAPLPSNTPPQPSASNLQVSNAVPTSNVQPPASASNAAPLPSNMPSQPSASNLQASDIVTPLTVPLSAPASGTALLPSNAPSQPPLSNSAALSSLPPVSAVVDSAPFSAPSPVQQTPSAGQQSGQLSPSVVPASESVAIVRSSESMRTPAGTERPLPSPPPPSPSVGSTRSIAVESRLSESLDLPFVTSPASRPSESRSAPGVVSPEASPPSPSRPAGSFSLPSLSRGPSPPVSVPVVTPSLSSPIVSSASVTPPLRTPASRSPSEPNTSLSPPSSQSSPSAQSSESAVPNSSTPSPNTPIITPSESATIPSNETPTSVSMSRPTYSSISSSRSSSSDQSSPVIRETPTSGTITASESSSTLPPITPSISISTPTPQTPISNSTVTTPTPVPSCQPESETPDFCPRQGCVDFNFDDNNCGGCNKKCVDLSSCSRGKCICQNEQVASPENNFCKGRNQTCESPNNVFCPEVGCIDLLTNATHCGSCQNACKDGLECYKGTCLCPVSHQLPKISGTCNGTNTTDCPAGQFLDEKYKKCCPTGSTWNQTRNACEEPSRQCEAGYAFDGETGLCCAISFISDYPCVCPRGLYKQANGTCTDVPPVKCDPGQVLDEKYNVCCKEGTTWNPSREQCMSKGSVCPEGQVFDPDYKKCCPKETVWNPQINNCTSVEPKTCPQKNFVLLEELGFCCPLAQKRATIDQTEWYLKYCTCTNGSTIDRLAGCDGKPPCPSGEHVDEKYAKCCKDGWAYDPNINECIDVTSKSRSTSSTTSSALPPLRQASSSLIPSPASSTHSPLLEPSSTTNPPTPPSSKTSSIPPPSPTTTPPSSINFPTPPVPPTPTACPLSLPDVCNGLCVNKANDTSHCGSCGVSCSAGWSCAEGGCGIVRGVGVQPQSTSTMPLLRLPSDAAEPFKPFLNTTGPSVTPKPVPKGAGGFIAKGFNGMWGDE